MSTDRWDELLLMADEVPCTIDVSGCDARSSLTSASGDEATLGMVHDENGSVVEFRISIRGSVLCRAGGAVLRRYVSGRSMKDVERLDEEAFLNLLEVPLTPSRRDCALLAHRALRRLLKTRRDANDD